MINEREGVRNMKHLTISEQFFLLVMNKKGTIGALNDYGKVSLVMAGLLDLQNAEVIEIRDSEVLILNAELPVEYSGLAPLVEKLQSLKKRTLEKVADAYAGTFLEKELSLLIASIREQLIKKGLVSKKSEEGIFGEKINWYADEPEIERIIYSIRKSFGSMEENLDQLALVLLLQKSSALTQYLSKHDQKIIKDELKALKRSDLAKDIQKMMGVIDQLYTVLAVAVIM